jgi:hypothetical protein
MATLTTPAARRQPSLLDPEPPPRGGFQRPGRPARPTSAPAPAPVAAPPAATARRETLEDRVGATWTALTTSHAAACPLCGGDIAPRYSAGARPVGGRCRSCATELG